MNMVWDDHGGTIELDNGKIVLQVTNNQIVLNFSNWEGWHKGIDVTNMQRSEICEHIEGYVRQLEEENKHAEALRRKIQDVKTMLLGREDARKKRELAT